MQEKNGKFCTRVCIGLIGVLQAYFKCTYECFDRKRGQDEISNCVECCSVPVVNAQQMAENEISNFQEMLNRSLMVCRDRFEVAKLQQRSDATMNLESCFDQSIQESIKTLPHFVAKLKTSLSIKD